MKTVGELVEWLQGAAAELGDPALAVTQIFVRFNPILIEGVQSTTGDLTASATANGTILLLNLFGNILPLPLDTTGAQTKFVDDGMMPLSEERLVAYGTYGIEMITPGVWSIDPSLNMPGALHAFVVVYDVPSPAPWERRVILPGSV